MSSTTRDSSKPFRTANSCFECAGVLHCWRVPQPDISREKARLTALHCQSLHRGRTVDVVRVRGLKPGMSRKKAEALVRAGRAEWIAPGQIQLRPCRAKMDE